MITAVVGHGRSPEGQAWGKRIDACDLVLRMWDWHWQASDDYGRRCDYSLLEASPGMMADFYRHKKNEPSIGWIASALWNWERCKLPPGTTVIQQRQWTEVAERMGGLGATGRLEFTRGTIAACWAIENSKRGDEVLLIGFDNVHVGHTMSIESGFSKAYREAASTFTFSGYVPHKVKNGNHDFGIEGPFIRHLARERGVKLSFSQEWWQDVPAVAARQFLKALVLGDATSVHEDAAAALAMFTPDAICATNNIGRDWPGRLDYWCTLHPNKCPDWPGIVTAMTHRLAAGRNRPQVWGHKPAPGLDRVTSDWHGSTGLLCVKVLREEDFERIVLAGVPLSRDGGHYYNTRVWNQADRYRIGWQKHRAELAPYVRSMGGWTRELLGAPTADWIAGQPA